MRGIGGLRAFENHRFAFEIVERPIDLREME